MLPPTNDRLSNACKMYATLTCTSGIFAWRYGYVPAETNPKRKSITELELREAERLGKPRLVFLLKPTVPWPPNMMDSTTGENERGARINALRGALQQERLAGMFETAEELAVKVVTALYRWQMESTIETPVIAKPPAEPGEPAQRRDGDSLVWTPGSRLRVRFLNGASSLAPTRLAVSSNLDCLREHQL